jgi:methionyl-tRNA formyltransferase
MKVLYYSNPDITDADLIPGIIRSTGDECVSKHSRITLDWVIENQIEFIVSDRSRFLIKQDLIDFLPRKIVNLHPSFLPWNRGYHPNYWSIKEGTPFGVTLHFIDADIDTGNILAQTRLFYNDEDTFKTTYERLRFAMVNLFKTYWPVIREGGLPDLPQLKDEGTLHFKRDFDLEWATLKNGWDTKLSDIEKRQPKGYNV